ncbi:MFS transporter [Virgibacillus ndiopensis]|uniref:MFS transporter n=1 Tax=Virgibacillus ndiopensis TaxID=2004408 RepID=UPI000C07C68C|nr:MFS transporter [Virgibacillus ndiopensis]
MAVHFHPNIKWRLFVGFITTMANMMITPYLIIYFSSKIGASITGILYIAIIVSAVIGSFAGGSFSDKIGRRKVMIGSEILVAFTFLIIAFLNSPWLDLPYITAVLFVINMFASGSFHPVVMALIVDCSTSETRETIFRFSYWINNLAIALGSLIGGFLFVNYHFILFLIVTFVSFFSVVVSTFLLTDEYKPKQINQTISQKNKPIQNVIRGVQSYSFIFKDKTFVYFIVGTLLVLGIETQLTNYIGLRLAQDISNVSLLSIGNFDFTIDGAELLGILKSENTLFVVVGTFFIARLIKQLSERIKLISGVLIFTFGFFVLTFHENPLVLVIAMVFATTGELIYAPVKQTVLGNIAPHESRSAYMAVNQISVYSAEIIAGFFIIIGSLFTPLFMAFVILLMGIAGAICFDKMIKRHELSGESRTSHTQTID